MCHLHKTSDAIRRSVTRDSVARDGATRDSATRDSATRDGATRYIVTQDSVSQDQVAAPFLLPLDDLMFSTFNQDEINLEDFC